MSGEAFYTKPNKEIYMVKKIVKKVTGNSAKLNCRGGTSDSRFLGSIPRLELGLRNTTIFPSGLVIYWTVNNVLTMAQQYVIIKRTAVKTVQ